ncbi:MAG: AAA family ATPase [Gaiella sp.]|nr:AAA family ATPase [Gaiella sp.]
MIGRERELEQARGLLAAVAGGSCALVLAGEPGIGKSTIWAAVLEDAETLGHRVLAARPSQAEAELPFAVLTDLFARIDETAVGDLPGVQRDALEQALRRRPRAATVDPTSVALATLGTLRALAAVRPTIVAIDDVQWIDAPSLRALVFALRRVREARVGLVAAARAGLQSGLTTLSPADVSAAGRIEIAGLDERHIAELVHARTGIALTPLELGRVVALSGGNPFYALELAAAGKTERGLPETLAAAVRARFSTLSSDARGAGLVAATLGRVDEPLVRRLHGPGLDELWSAGIVDDRRGEPWFAHPLLASALIDLHSPAERRAVHLALATALSDPDERALHLGRGTEDASEAVAAELEAAAGRLDARGAPETAALLADRAAALTPADDRVAAIRRLLLASDLYQGAGEGRDHVLPLLEHLAETLPSGPDRARVLVRLGWLGAQLDTLSMSESVAFQERALEEAGAAADVTTAAHAVLARLRGIGGDYRTALRHAEHAVAVGATTEADLMFPSPAGELAIARFFAGEGLDERLFAEGIEIESRAGPRREPYQSPKLQLGLALLYTGRLAEARSLLSELLDLSVQLGRVRSTAGCLLHLTELEVRAGDLAQAGLHAREFLHIDRQLRGELSSEWYPSALVALHTGRTDDARRILTRGVEDSKAIESTTWLAHQLEALGHLELASGDLPAARAALVPVVPMLRAAGLGEWAAHPAHPDLVEALVGLGELDEAASLQAELDEYGRRLDRAWGRATAARTQALIASARGDLDAALAAAEQALAEHERLDWPLERARTLLVAGTVLRRAGRRRDAAELLAGSRSLLAEIRNPLWLARVEEEERRLGGRRGPTDALTPTEERIAELAGQGLRNAEIATRLYVTPKTVEATLSRVYRKLGIRSRTELARARSAVE